jgi:hypothetical protein
LLSHAIIRRNFSYTAATSFCASGFFLMFVPTGAAISIDRLCASARQRRSQRRSLPWSTDDTDPDSPSIFQRSLKTMGRLRNGTALYYTSRLVIPTFPDAHLENGLLLGGNLVRAVY